MSCGHAWERVSLDDEPPLLMCWFCGELRAVNEGVDLSPALSYGPDNGLEMRLRPKWLAGVFDSGANHMIKQAFDYLVDRFGALATGAGLGVVGTLFVTTVL